MDDQAEMDTEEGEGPDHEAMEASGELDAIHERALRRFDDCTGEQELEQRAASLAARRFVSIPGAQWEGTFGDAFPDRIQLEINKVGRAVRKIKTDYISNRIVPEFRPAGGPSDDKTADTLAGLLRADAYQFKSQQAYDNAFMEAVAGGFGAFRLANVLEDEYDPDNDNQRINPGMLIADADQCVFFDPQSRLYDKSDARFAFVVTQFTPDAFKDEYGDEMATDWPDKKVIPWRYDWFTVDTVRVAEYYEKVDVTEKLHVLKFALTGDEERFWDSEVDPEFLKNRKRLGWTATFKKRKRCIVNKYIMTGAEVIEGPIRIAGKHIPIVPVYGQREFVDGLERFKGHVQERMDAQRLYNANVSRLAEVQASSPGETPIFAAQQMEGEGIKELWRTRNVERPSYLVVDPLFDPATGQILSAGPIGTLAAPQMEPVTAGLLQIANTDLTEDDADGADTVKANISAEAMDIAASRVDAKSGIYLDNMRQSVQRAGEIYLGMAAEVYAEPDREVETMTEEGGDGVAKLHDHATMPDGSYGTINDFARGKYKVIATVAEATATRRDKTVRSSLNMADVALKAGDQELATAAILTAIANSDGEGIDELKEFARQKGLNIGLHKPTEDEKAALEQATQAAGEDPNTALVVAQAEQLTAAAEKDKALAGKAVADTDLAKAKTMETLVKANQPPPANDGPLIRRGDAFGQM